MKKSQKIKKKLIFFCLLTGIYTLTCTAQENKTRKPVINENHKQEVIDTCLAAFHKYYIYPDMVKKMESYIAEQTKNGVYAKIADIKEITKQLRHDLRDVSGDGHIWIDIIENLRLTPGPPTTEEIAQKKKDNFGFVSRKIFDGNIGYLKLLNFQDPSYASDSAVQSMMFLADCQAVIIDLRDNHGGDAKMVHFISSYFLPAGTPLNSLYFRAEDTLRQAWSHDEVEGRRLLDVDLYILVNRQTTSAAESFTYLMQSYERAKIIGENTRGAAHWVESFSYPELGVFFEIPVARPINPVTNMGWDGIGVKPDIEVDPALALETALAMAQEKSPNHE